MTDALASAGVSPSLRAEPDRPGQVLVVGPAGPAREAFARELAQSWAREARAPVNDLLRAVCPAAASSFRPCVTFCDLAQVLALRALARRDEFLRLREDEGVLVLDGLAPTGRRVEQHLVTLLCRRLRRRWPTIVSASPEALAEIAADCRTLSTLLARKFGRSGYRVRG